MSSGKKFAVILGGVLVLGGVAFAMEDKDLKPERAAKEGYFVSGDEAKERGGVGEYVHRTTEREKREQKHADRAATVKNAAQATASPALLAQLKEKPAEFYFGLGSSRLSLSDRDRLDSIAEALKASPGSRLEIDGYADALGTPDFNRTLSAERAQEVRDYLEAKGVRPEQLGWKAYGETRARPVVSRAGNSGDRKVLVSVG